MWRRAGAGIHREQSCRRLRRGGERETGTGGVRAGQRRRVRVRANTADLAPRRLRPSDLARVASVGLRTRRLRASLSALGIAIGVAAIVAVLGLSSSSQAGLLSQIDRLGTNLLTVTNGQSLTGKTAELPLRAPAMIARIDPVTSVAETAKVTASVFRTPLIPAIDTNALSVQAASVESAGDARREGRAGALPERGDGDRAGRRAGCCGGGAPRRGPPLPGRADLDGGSVVLPRRAFSARRCLRPKSKARCSWAFPAAERYLASNGHADTVYVRAQNEAVPAVQSVLARDGQPRSTERSRRQPAVGRPGCPGGREERAERPVPRAGRGGAARGRGGRGEHHGDLRAGTPLGDRPAPGARSDERAKSGRSSSPRRSCSRSVAAPSESASAPWRPPSMRRPRAGRS